MKNNKGFTLIELILVLVIFSIILIIAVPSVSSTIERRKDKDKNYKIDLVLSAAEMYVDINKSLFEKDNITEIGIDNIICSGLINKSQIEDPYNKNYIINGKIEYDSSLNSVKWKNLDGISNIKINDPITCNSSLLKVIYDVNEGYDWGNKVQLIRKNRKFNIIGDMPKRQGYEFQGWTLNKDSGEIFYPNQEITLESEQKLYAKWEKMKNISYIFNPVKGCNIIDAWLINDNLYDSNIFVSNLNDNYKIKFLCSGTLTVTDNVIIDSFLVGGGGPGYFAVDSNGREGAGGGGGYTTTARKITLNANKDYIINVGAGGIASSQISGNASYKNGEASYIKLNNNFLKGSDDTLTNAEGGYMGDQVTGGKGGSGGAPGAYWHRDILYKITKAGQGGSDGSNGEELRNISKDFPNGTFVLKGGVGQHTTTREFGEPGGTVYSGGGGGGAGYSGFDLGLGGLGGGGNGAGYTKKATEGKPNTGGGGGGGSAGYGIKEGPERTKLNFGANGGSGIVIIRNARN